MRVKRSRKRERGSVMIVSLVLVIGLAGLSSVYLSRALYERSRSSVQEDSLEALFEAYGKLAKAEAYLNRAEYDDSTGRNLELQAALDKEDNTIRDSEVVVTPEGEVDSTIFFTLTTSATVGRVTREIRVLIREKESFADYNYFVNIHPLGIAGRPTPRGSIHTNKAMEFYFPNGEFVDPVTAGEGFSYKAGATEENTTFSGPSNDSAKTITDLTDVDIPAIAGLSTYVSDDPDINVKILLEGDQIRIVKYTRPGIYIVPNVIEKDQVVGTEDVVETWEEPVYKTETYTEMQDVFETKTVTYTVMEKIYGEEDYEHTEIVPIYEDQTVEYTETVPVYEMQDVTKTKSVPVHATKTVTKYKEETVWVEDTEVIGGGTDIAGSPTGTPGHWEKQEVAYDEVETYISHYEDEEYTVKQSVWVRDDVITKTKTVSVKIGEDVITSTKTQTVVIGEEPIEKTKTVTEKVGEEEVTLTKQVLDYMEEKSKTVTVDIVTQIIEVDGTKEEWRDSEEVGEEVIGADGVIYVEGSVISLEGELDGNVSIAAGGSVYITGSLVYVDDKGRTAYLNGDNEKKAYEPNSKYEGDSVLGVIADGNILYTKDVPEKFELNGSFLSRDGRIGITGVDIDEAGEAFLVGK